MHLQSPVALHTYNKAHAKRFHPKDSSGTTMRVCGFVISASEIRIVSLEGSRNAHERIAAGFHKLVVGDTGTSAGMRAVTTALNAHIRDGGIERVGLISYTSGGKFPPSAAVFRVEGALLSTAEAEFRFVPKKTLEATYRRSSELMAARPSTTALALAYDLAFECLD